MWNVKLKRLNIQPKTGLKALEECSELIYPNLSKLFKIFCTLPMSTATPERMFSCLKRLKGRGGTESHFYFKNILAYPF